MYDKQPIIYYPSSVLPLIVNTLSQVNASQVINSFNKDEMLEDGIYYQALDKDGILHRKDHLTILYPELKTFFSNAFSENHHIILEYGP